LPQSHPACALSIDGGAAFGLLRQPTHGTANNPQGACRQTAEKIRTHIVYDRGFYVRAPDRRAEGIETNGGNSGMV